MTPSTHDLCTLAWGQEPARRAYAAAELAVVLRRAAGVMTKALSAYVVKSEASGEVAAFDPRLMFETSCALADLAELAEELGSMEVRLLNAPAAPAAGSPTNA
jgi:hypothetical protein